MFGKKDKTVIYTTSDNKILDTQIKISETKNLKEKKFETAWEKICRENREADDRNSQNDSNNSSSFDPNRGW